MSLAAGMNDHITKPIILNDLFAALNKWIKKEPEARA
jgi:CheY-like chemotaxis protein